MRWPRWTTRRIMAAVFALAVALGLGIPAVAVVGETSPHVYGWVGSGDDLFGMAWEEIARPPFWTRYRHRLAGQSWAGSPTCGMGQGRPAETCYFQTLGMMDDPDEWHDRVTATPAMNAALDHRGEPASP